MINNIMLELAYDGTNYHGWQRQQNAVTIQQMVETAITKICGEVVSVVGCSRTDAKVHAAHYCCNFQCSTAIPMHKLYHALNTALPFDIRATNSLYVQPSFHAQKDATFKLYTYKLLNRPVGDVFLRNYAWHLPYPLDIELMRSACGYIIGERDFRGFMASGCTVKNTVRNLSVLTVDANDDIITITAGANGFLYNMVRIIVGTLCAVGMGKLPIEELEYRISCYDRRLLGVTAPPHGLTLFQVRY